MLLFCAFTSPSAQSDLRPGWKALEGSGLYVEVPEEFKTHSATVQGHIDFTTFKLNYVSAANLNRGMFVSAGSGLVPLAPNVDEDDLDALAEDYLGKFFGPLMLPDIGTFICDPQKNKTTQYESLGAAVRETNAISQGTGQEYRIYFVFATKPAAMRRAKLIYIVAGCPVNQIEANSRVMSTILASFKVD
jgi:hypothetical protein